MKKKIVRLTESDLVHIVKKVINEQSSTLKAGDKATLKSLPEKIKDFAERYKLTGNFSNLVGEFFIYDNTHVISVNDINIYEKNKNQVSDCERKISDRQRKRGELFLNKVEAGMDISKASLITQNNPDICDAVVRVKTIIDTESN